MMLEFLETGKALYVLAAVCVLGLMNRLVARNLYKRLMKETDNMTLTKNRYLRELKQKMENTYRLNQGIRNGRVYLEKQLASYHFLGASLSGWGSFGGQMTILCFLLGGVASFGAYWYRCDSYYIVLYGSVGILAGLFTMMADYWANLSERRAQLLNTLQDYMENSLFTRLGRETSQTAAEESRYENGKQGAAAARESIRTLERRNGRPNQAARATHASQGSGEEGRGRMEAGHQDCADPDLIGRDLDELSRARYGNRESLSEGKPPEREGKERKESRGEREAEMERNQRRGGRPAKRNQDEPEGKEPDQGHGDADYLKNSLEQIAASRERGRTEGEWIKELSSDELELVGQILKQYLG